MTASRTFVADAHAVVWDFLSDGRLSVRAKEILRSAERGEVTLVIPTIVLAEIQRISERRITSVSVPQILLRFGRIPNLVIAPFNFETFQEMARLSPELELHDRIIAATARVYGATLITRDATLTTLVETVW